MVGQIAVGVGGGIAKTNRLSTALAEANLNLFLPNGLEIGYAFKAIPVIVNWNLTNIGLARQQTWTTRWASSEDPRLAWLTWGRKKG